MGIIFSIIMFLFISSSVYGLELQKANLYVDQKISGWLMSEKLDGIRAYWDGKHLYTRNKKLLIAPLWFTKDLPPFALDGELWTSRGEFEEIQSIVMSQKPSKRWMNVKYMIFEVPHAKGDFYRRMAFFRKYEKKALLWHVEIIEQKKCLGEKELEIFMDEVLLKGGEGVMLKDPTQVYQTGRSNSLLKYKKFTDTEAKVIGYKPGKGKFKGSMGSLHVQLDNGTRFFIGSGFSSEERKNPPKIGTIVTFRHNGYTKQGKPKFASFIRVRED